MISGKFLVSLFAFSFALLSPAKALAIDTPQFPLCVNPTGQLIASYDSGVHGIPGDSNTHTGSDKVYSVNADQLIQCFCAEDGTGIQTNWLKVGSISETERKSYERDGWIYIPNGSLWGLENTAYIAKNSRYVCKSTSASGGNQSSTGTGGSSQGFSAVFDGSTGLASTGNTKTTLAFFLGGIVLLIIGTVFKRNSA